MAQDKLLLSDGTSHLQLSDGVSLLLLSTSTTITDPAPYTRTSKLDGRRTTSR